MKVLLLANNINWKTLPKRVKELELYLMGRLHFMHEELTITIKHIDTDVKVSSWNNHVDDIWFRSELMETNPDYDAVGLLMNKKDWKGRKDLGGEYFKDFDKRFGFYVISDERQTVKRTGGKRRKAFELFFEHEFAGHGVAHDLGLKWESQDTHKFLAGYDNTHYFFYNSKLDEHYDYIKAEYDKVVAKLESKLQKARDILAQVGKKEVSSTKVPLSLLNRLQLDFEALRGICEILYGYNLRITEGFRSFDVQNEYYSRGRTKVGKIITNAKGGQSLHQYGVAIDIVDRQLGYDIDFKKVAHIWDLVTDFKGEWGGNWKNFVDAPHFQNTLGHTLKDFQEGKVDYSKFE